MSFSLENLYVLKKKFVFCDFVFCMFLLCRTVCSLLSNERISFSRVVDLTITQEQLILIPLTFSFSSFLCPYQIIPYLMVPIFLIMVAFLFFYYIKQVLA